MADEFADARGVVVARHARTGAGDGPRFHQVAAHGDEALGRGTHDGPALACEQAGERRGIGRAQTGMQGRRRQRPVEARAPAAREIGLEDIARGEMVEDAFDAVGETRRRVFVERVGRCPGGQRRQRARCVDVAREGVQPVDAVGFRQGDAFARRMVAQDGCGAAQGAGHGQHAVGLRQAQYRFDFAGEFVGKEQGPTAAERPARLVAWNARGLPGAIEGFEESATGLHLAGFVLHDAVMAHAQRCAVGGEQQVPAPLRRAVRARFEQHGIARGRHPVQGQQVETGREVSGDEHGPALLSGSRSAGHSRRNTSVPLVPPKPKPFDTAMSICFSRAVLGT
jgi:hypothetical protein